MRRGREEKSSKGGNIDENGSKHAPEVRHTRKCGVETMLLRVITFTILLFLLI